jgi:plasmid maintenance system antidote protein VapI
MADTPKGISGLIQLVLEHHAQQQAQVQNQYKPDYVTPPGETLQDTLDTLGIGKGDFAERMGLTERDVDNLMQGDVIITEEVANQLEQTTGVPATFWNNRERRYREFLAEAQQEQA